MSRLLLLGGLVSCTGGDSLSPDAGRIVLSPSLVNFTATVGGPPPLARAVSVTSSAGGPVAGLTVTTIYDNPAFPDWLSVTVSGSAINLFASIGGLPVGTHQATVRVAAAAVLGIPTQDLRVTLVLSAPVVRPTIGVSSTLLTFTAAPGGANPAPLSANVTNTGTGVLSGLAASISYQSGQPTGWLTATLTSTSAPSVLSLRAVTGSLAVGTYTATVSLSSSAQGVTNSPLAITVRFTVAVIPTPTIMLSQTVASFSAPAGGVNPAPIAVNITNTGTGTLSGLSANVSYSAGQPTGWLATALNTTTAPAVLTLSATPGTRPVGSYNASVTIASSAPGVTNNPQQVSVTFTILAPPTIAISETTLAFSGFVGATSPPARDVSVTNSGSGSLTGLASSIAYQSGQPAGWLTATLSSTTSPANLSVVATTGTLAAGTYNATLSISSSAAGVTNSPRTIPVTFTITAAPRIVLSSSAVALAGTVGGANPSSTLNVSITNAAPGALAGLDARVVYGSGQASGWLTASLDRTTTPASLSLSAAVGTLAAGVYSATVEVSSSAPGVINSPIGLAVWYRIAAPAAGTLTAGSLQAGSIDAAGEVDLYTFNGESNSLVTVALAEVTSFGNLANTRARVTVSPPTGAALAAFNANNLSNIPVMQSGTYTVRVQAADLSSRGPYTVGLSAVLPAAPISTMQCGSLTTGRIGSAGQVDTNAFQGQTGGRVLISIAEVTSFGNLAQTRARVQVINPPGAVVAAFNANTSQEVALTFTGTYLVRVYAANLLSTGTYNVGLTCLN